MNIQDRIDKKEREIVEDARNLRRDQLDALDNILGNFEGVAFDDLDSAGQSSLVSIANQYGIPFDILKESMNLQKQSMVFKTAQDIKKYNATTGANKGGGTGLGGSADTSGEIRSWLLANKRANPSKSYYELWGELADEMRVKGLNPGNYDREFWKVLHPEGLAGYNKYVKNSVSNPFQ